MKVKVAVSIGKKEYGFVGDAPFLSTPNRDYTPDLLEETGIGFWMRNWRDAPGRGKPHSGRLFLPWTSVLFVEEV